MAFSDLEEQKHKNFLEKQYADAHAQEDHSLRSRDQLLWAVMFVSVVITYYPLH